MLKMIKSFVRDETGGTAIEYALIATGLSIAIVAGVVAIGTTLASGFQSVADGF